MYILRYKTKVVIKYYCVDIFLKAFDNSVLFTLGNCLRWFSTTCSNLSRSLLEQEFLNLYA